METKTLKSDSFEEALTKLQDVNTHLEYFNIMFNSNPTGTMYKGRKFHPHELSWFKSRGSRVLNDEQKNRIAIIFEFVLSGDGTVNKYYFIVGVTRNENEYTLNYVCGQQYEITLSEFKDDRLVCYSDDSQTKFNHRRYESIFYW
jgi:hypothetical protein